MMKVTLPLAAIALVGLYAGTASAQSPCTYNTAPAKGIKGSVVRAYAPCPGTEHGSPNSETEGGTTACAPAIPREVDGDSTPYKFSEKGKCSVQTSGKLVSDCSTLEDAGGNNLGLESGACHVTFVKSKCSGLVHSDGTTAVDGTLFNEDDGWTLATLSRATMDDDTNGEMTVIDFPVTFNYSTPAKGKMSLSSSSAEALIPLVTVNNADLPPCTSIEVVDVVIKDPDGLPFARLGQATVGTVTP